MIWKWIYIMQGMWVPKHMFHCTLKNVSIIRVDSCAWLITFVTVSSLQYNETGIRLTFAESINTFSKMLQIRKSKWPWLF